MIEVEGTEFEVSVSYHWMIGQSTSLNQFRQEYLHLERPIRLKEE